MKLYFAPMEGITLAVFRRIHHRHFPGIEKYFSPFLVANQTLHFHKKEIRDILPEANPSVPLVPQILTNKADQMLWAVETLAGYGYREINLNLGCSMPQVAKRGRGAGFLADAEALDDFFTTVFKGLKGRDISLSVKTRIGLTDPGEARELLEVFNRHPLCELIVHPRLMRELYSGKPHLDVFSGIFSACRHPVCYNGDIFSEEDFKRLKEAFPGLDRCMLGRGLLMDPALARRLQGGNAAPAEELKAYHDALLNGFLGFLPDGRQAVTKMKGIWSFWGDSFPGKEKELKKLRKSIWPDEYRKWAAEILSS